MAQLPKNFSGVIEELDIKEPTPSIAPSVYESAQYSKKWRILLAVLLGCVLIALCMLGFFVNAESRADRRAALMSSASENPLHMSYHSTQRWRLAYNQHCQLENNTCDSDYKPTILIGIGGLRPDFITELNAPALYHMIKCGSSAESLVPVYPTNTFPNMYTIVTGLYPESHGIIDDKMMDPSTKTKFSRKESYYVPSWWGGEPIWNTVSNQGKISAAYFWPGSDVLIQEKHPSEWEKFKTSIPYTDRINQVMKWMKEDKPNFISLYLESVEEAARTFGPFSNETNDSIKEVSEAIDYFMTELDNHSNLSCANIIVVSDHGIAPAVCGQTLYMRAFHSDIGKDIENRTTIFTGTVGRIRANDGIKADLDIFKKIRCKNPNLRVLSKELLPKRYHYANNDRIENVILDTKPGFRIVTESTYSCLAGEHGFDNLEPSMQAAFIAYGPSFKSGFKTKSFRNVEIYNLLCKLIGIEPAPNNGTYGSLHFLLNHEGNDDIDLDVLTEDVKGQYIRPIEKQEEVEFFQKCQCEVPTPEIVPNVTTASSTSESTTTTTSSTSTASTSTTTATPITEPTLSTTTNQTLAQNYSLNKTEENITMSNHVVNITEVPPTKTSRNILIEDSATEENKSNQSTIIENTTQKLEINETQMLISTDEVIHPIHEIGSETDVENTFTQINITSDNVNSTIGVKEESNIVENGMNLNTTVEEIVLTQANTTVTQENLDRISNTTFAPEFLQLNETTNSSTLNESQKISTTAAPLSSITTPIVNITTPISSTTAPETTANSEVPVSSLTTTVSPTSDTFNSSPATPVSSTTATTNSDTTSSSTESISSSTAPRQTQLEITTTASNITEALSSSPEPNEKIDFDSELTTILPEDETEIPISEINVSRKKRDLSQILDDINKHCPWGTPARLKSGNETKLNILLHTSYVIGFPSGSSIASWISYTFSNTSLNKLENGVKKLEDGKLITPDPAKYCWAPDPRLSTPINEQCENFNKIEENSRIRQLFPEELELPDNLRQEGYLFSNIAPTEKGFLESGRRVMLQAVKTWAQNIGILNVVHGPIFDKNLDGKRDEGVLPEDVPSDYFYVVTTCQNLDKKEEQLNTTDTDSISNSTTTPSPHIDFEEEFSSCPIENIQVLPFTFPNTEYNDSCQLSDEEYLRYHLTTLKDIELLTGIKFFKTIRGQDSLRFSIQQPLSIWPIKDPEEDKNNRRYNRYNI